MNGREDLTGRTFGRLTVIGEKGYYDYCKTPILRCRCSCGRECLVLGNNLRSGKTQSCGCIRSERMRRINEKRKAGCALEGRTNKSIKMVFQG